MIHDLWRIRYLSMNLGQSLWGCLYYRFFSSFIKLINIIIVNWMHCSVQLLLCCFIYCPVYIRQSLVSPHCGQSWRNTIHSSNDTEKNKNTKLRNPVKTRTYVENKTFRFHEWSEREVRSTDGAATIEKQNARKQIENCEKNLKKDSKLSTVD